MSRYLSFSVIRSVVAAVTLVSCPYAAATGWYNLPSNFCQMMGIGFGGGYHAPMVLGPPDGPRGACRFNEKRQFHPPRAHCVGGACAHGYQSMPSHYEMTAYPSYAPMGQAPASIPQQHYLPTMDARQYSGYPGTVMQPASPSPAYVDGLSEKQQGPVEKQDQEPAAEQNDGVNPESLPMPTI